MKNNKHICTVSSIIAVATLFGAVAKLHAQGSLTPPAGPITPVMKSLDQIEARKPVNTLPGDANAVHVITLPGSYYLTDNISGVSGKAGIRIEAANVTLDLNGFVLEAPSGATVGILLNVSGGNVNIRNGQLRFWPQGGVTSAIPVNCSVEDLTIASVSGPGVWLPSHAVLRRVSVKGAVGVGLHAKYGRIMDCSVEDVTSAQAGANALGIVSESGSVLGSTVRNINGRGPTRGISASLVRDAVVENIQTTNGGAFGISANVVDNTGDSVWTGSAENCQVRNVTGPAFTQGIYYFGSVRGCTVSAISAAGVAGYAAGIGAIHTSDSQVIDVKAGGSWAFGITANSVADCVVQIIQNTGGGKAIGIMLDMGDGSESGGIARNCVVRGADDYGIYAVSGAVVSGCSVVDFTLPPYVNTATAFYAYSTRNVFMDNSSTAGGFTVGTYNVCKGNIGPSFSGGIITAPDTASATNVFSNIQKQ